LILAPPYRLHSRTAKLREINPHAGHGKATD
jgi:hypothetical protein